MKKIMILFILCIFIFSSISPTALAYYQPQRNNNQQQQQEQQRRENERRQQQERQRYENERRQQQEHQRYENERRQRENEERQRNERQRYENEQRRQNNRYYDNRDWNRNDWGRYHRERGFDNFFAGIVIGAILGAISENQVSQEIVVISQGSYTGVPYYQIKLWPGQFADVRYLNGVEERIVGPCETEINVVTDFTAYQYR